MPLSKMLRKRRLLAAAVGGVLSLGVYRLYLYINNREQFEDSNALVALVFASIATAIIYVILKIISNISPPNRP